MQYEAGCWWFDTPDQCHILIILIAALTLCAVTDIAMTTSIVMLGSKGSHRKRCEPAVVDISTVDAVDLVTASFPFLLQAALGSTHLLNAV